VSRASTRWRAVVAFLALPGIVAFVLPLGLAMSNTPRPRFDPLGLPVAALGVILLLWCVRDFYVAGQGTLAPWAPPKRLVVVGLYRLSRNPMYIAVLLILWGWAISFHSRLLAIYAVAMMLAFHFRIVSYEEPWLLRRFGKEWIRYSTEVPRWIGRRGPASDRGS
jgi:protein-S-isoprenylcysteine O-methyltransferase Ste14